jgi:hypothetical protein
VPKLVRVPAVRDHFSEVVSLNGSFQLRLRLTDPDTVADEVFRKHSRADQVHDVARSRAAVA